MTKRILALNAYHGGSHRVFLDGWRQHSRHEFTLLTLPAFYHEDTPAALADRLLELAHCKEKAAVWPAGLEPTALVQRFAWPTVAAAMDDALDRTKL